MCFEQAFHGRSMGALSVTPNAKYQKPFMPLIPGVKVGKLNDTASMQELVGEKTCAVIVEPVQGEGGIYPAEESWLRALRKRCDETGAVLIFDEIQVSLFELRHVTVDVPVLRVTWDANVRSSLAADSVGYTEPGRCGHILPYRPTVIPIL